HRLLNLHTLAGNLGAGRAVCMARAHPVLGNDRAACRAGHLAARPARPHDATVAIRDAADRGENFAADALRREHAEAARRVVALGGAVVHEPDGRSGAGCAAAHLAEPADRLAADFRPDRGDDPLVHARLYRVPAAGSESVTAQIRRSASDWGR